MNQKEKNARRLVRQANGLSPGFRWFDNPYAGQTEICPACGKTIDAGLETCPECGKALPGAIRAGEKIGRRGLILLIALLAALTALGLYFFLRAMAGSGFLALLLGS